MHSDSDNKKKPIFSIPFRKNALVDNLLITIENIVAGTANVSMKILSKSLVEWKIELFSNSCIIILRYESKCEENESVRMIPVIDYKIVDEKSGPDDRNIVLHESIASSGEGNSSSSYDIKQNIPELLFVLKDEEKKDENIDENKSKAVSAETNISTRLDSCSIYNYSEGVSSSNGRRLMDVTAYHSNTASLHTEEVEEQNRNYGDERNKEKYYRTGNDNGITRKERKAFKRTSIKKQHIRMSTREKPCIFNMSGKHVSTSRNATEDKKIHTVEKKFTCEECGKCFASFGSLHIHKRIHTGEKPYQCEICGKSFSRVSHLQVHKRIHTCEKPYQCEVCGKSFNQVGSLNMHKRIHTGEKPYECEVCGKCFSRVSCLNIHKRVHTGEKPYKCSNCGKSFSALSSVVRHQRLYSGEKPLTCDVRSKCSANLGSLTYHKVHKN